MINPHWMCYFPLYECGVIGSKVVKKSSALPFFHVLVVTFFLLLSPHLTFHDRKRTYSFIDEEEFFYFNFSHLSHHNSLTFSYSFFLFDLARWWNVANLCVRYKEEHEEEWIKRKTLIEFWEKWLNFFVVVYQSIEWEKKV